MEHDPSKVERFLLGDGHWYSPRTYEESEGWISATFEWIPDPEEKGSQMPNHLMRIRIDAVQAFDYGQPPQRVEVQRPRQG